MTRIPRPEEATEAENRARLVSAILEARDDPAHPLWRSLSRNPAAADYLLGALLAHSTPTPEVSAMRPGVLDAYLDVTAKIARRG